MTMQNHKELLHNIKQILYIIQNMDDQHCSLLPSQSELPSGYKKISVINALTPRQLGDREFLKTHHLKLPYIVGAMANGIASAKLVINAARAGFLGFFGSAGLRPAAVADNIEKIKSQLDDQHLTFGSNIISSPQDTELEDAIVDVYLQHQVTRISASAYMRLTPCIVRYACKGLHTDAQGNIKRQNYVFAKVSRPEVAEKFMSPAPANILNTLVKQGKITQREADLASVIPVANDITVEADSGGHTDNRPLNSLFPTILNLSKKLVEKYDYETPVRLGAAGGIGTPAATLTAFEMGACYVLTGSINQASLEADQSDLGKQMLQQAGIADIMMTAAADMFEMGVKVQVLKRDTMYGIRAAKLYELYKKYNAYDDIPPKDQKFITETILRASFEDIWQTTKKYFAKIAPDEITKAEKNPKHKMALVFRWYLGSSSKWAIAGDVDRQKDYQLWCGPAMGAFNDWVTNSFLADLTNRSAEQIAYNLLYGAAALYRVNQARIFNIDLANDIFHFNPKKLTLTDLI
jgi:trans-AT polyketide synthase, acyltransferase and oxidoreductase domains